MTDFADLAAFRALIADLPQADAGARAAARARDAALTKPPGALGRLEAVAVWLAGWQGTPTPRVDNPQIAIFAGNHGVAALGVSAFPAEVTQQMVANFAAGGAAINQLARSFGARLTVHPIELDRPTADFTQGAAMSEAECVAALRLGWEAVDAEADVFVAGEMGIANTTVAAALACALYDGAPADWVGRGTGVDDAGLRRKVEVVTAGLARHRAIHGDPLAVLQHLGGREIAAMTGAIARARVLRVPVVLDGFITCAAAAVLARLQEGALDHCIAGHVSAEAAHARLLGHLGLEPLLALGLRLGEGSGAALALGVVKAAAACHFGMATFAEAGVSQA